MKKIWSQGKEDGPKSRLRQRYMWNMGAQLDITILPSNAKNQFPQFSPHCPEFSPLEHPESLQSLFHMTAFQPLEDRKSRPP